METIGHYTIISELGRGGVGLVYRAHDARLGRDVAIKLLHRAEGPRAERDLRRFEREARALAQLDHPNIVRVHFAGFEGSRPYLVMDFVDGETLGDLLRRGGPLAVGRAVDVVYRVALGMAQAHTLGILHRDIKPANVLLDRLGEPQLTDFGLAKDLMASTNDSLSQTGFVLGTPGYWPPEQAVGDRSLIGTSSDVYGLGGLLYAALTGEAPLETSTTLGEAIAATCGRDAVPPSTRRPDVPPELDAICMRCLHKDPGQRYGSAGELARALKRFLDCGPDEEPAPRSPAFKGHPAVWALAGALGSTLILGVVWALVASRADPPAPPLPPAPSPLAGASQPAEQDPATPSDPPRPPPPRHPPQRPLAIRAVDVESGADALARLGRNQPLTPETVLEALSDFRFDAEPETSFAEARRMLVSLGPRSIYGVTRESVSGEFAGGHLTIWDNAYGSRTAYSFRCGPERGGYAGHNRTYAEVLKPQVMDGVTIRASHCRKEDTLRALRDGLIDVPDAPIMSWRGHTGTREWVEFAFREARPLSSATVYWAEEAEGLALPDRWRLLIRRGDAWEPVDLLEGERYRLARFGRVSFREVLTERIRLEVDLPEGSSCGLQEWQVR